MRKKNRAVVYVHGKGGSASECEHYRPLFPDCDVLGLDYQTSTPWEAGEEIRTAIDALHCRCDSVTLIANSIGAFFSLHAGLNGLVDMAYLISPIVDMEKLIGEMMRFENVTEEDLRAKGVIPTFFGEDLSWQYLSYVRSRLADWKIPTRILYGDRDTLTSLQSIRSFAKSCGASLTIMENGEHWFHTEEQLRFLDEWILREEGRSLIN